MDGNSASVSNEAGVGEGPVAQCWREALGEAGSAHAGFISSGGNSLRAARLIGLIKRRCGVEVPLSLVLGNASITDIQNHVDAASGDAVGGGEPPAPPRSRSPLAPEQRRIWLFGRLHPESPAYNVVAAVRLRGRLEVPVLRRALDGIAARHDILRARVVTGAGGEPEWAYALDGGALPLVVREAAGPLTAGALAEFVRAAAEEVVPDHTAPLARATLLRSAAGDEAGLVIVLHHLIADQASVDMLLGEVAAFYTADVHGASGSGRAAPGSGRPAPSYAAYAHDAVARDAGDGHLGDLAYWRDRLAGIPAETALPLRRRRPEVPAFRGEATTRRFGTRTGERLDPLLRERGLTPMSFFLACVTTVLAAWSGGDDAVLGVPFSRRRTALEQDLAGFLLGTLPIRLTVDRTETVLDLAAQARGRLAEAVEHSGPAFDAIVEELGLASRPGRNPVFQVWVNDLTGVAGAPSFAGLTAEPLPPPMTSALFDLGWYLWRRAGGYEFQLVRDTGLFTAEVAAELADQVLRVVRQAAADPAAPIGDLDLRGAGAGPPVPDGRDAPVRRTRASDLVRGLLADAQRRPDATAIVAGPARIGYGELGAAVRRCAARAADAGVGAGTVVELRAGRDPAYPVALLATWARDACPVIVDAAGPAGRLRACRELIRPAAVVSSAYAWTSRGRSPGTPPLDGVPVRVERLAGDCGEPEPGLSHVLLTSGSTAEPLAVRVPHGPIGAFARWYAERFRPGPDDKFALLAGLGHDPVIRDILVPLLAGAELHIPPPEVFEDPSALSGWLARSGITVVHVTPALLELLLAVRDGAGGAGESRRLDHLRLVVCAGAPLTAGLARRLRAVSDAVLVNAFGTTETPQIAACEVIDDAILDAAPSDEAPLPVGRGVAGHEIAVVTPEGRPAAPGQRGEVVVRGPHLAEGYVRADPERAARFGPAPSGAPGVRGFATGDLGFTDLAGRVVVDGRGDRQVSINGFRLELGEVEAAAAAHPGVRDAAAFLRATPVGPALTLRAGRVPGASPSAEALRRRLSAHLPAYAVPSLIEIVDRVPLTANHKHAPAQRAAPAADCVATAPARRAGGRVAALAEQIVGHPLDPDENFFDAGMTSLMLVRFHERLVGDFGADIPITMLFTRVTLRSLSEVLDADRPVGDRVDAPPHPPAGSGTKQGEPRDLGRIAASRRDLRRRIRQVP